MNETISINEAKHDQIEMIDKKNKLKGFILLEEQSITKKRTESIIKKAKTKTQRKETVAVQKIVLRDELKVHDKRTGIIDASVSKNVFYGNPETNIVLKF